MSRKLRVLVSVSNDLYTDQRVDKVCRFLIGQGYDVLLIGRRRKSSVELPSRPYATRRLRLLFDRGPLFYACLNMRLFLFLLFSKANVLLSNDLDTLPANYLTWRLKGKKQRLVYDSHEFFTEVPELTSRPRVRKIWLAIEKHIFPKLEHIYTVNESIAERYKERYGKNLRVVRNLSPKLIDQKLKSKAELGIPEGVPLIIMQGAGININRGAEEAVEAMKDLNAVLLIVGDGDVLPHLKQLVVEQHLEKKVLFFGKKPYTEMMQYTQHADIGLSLDKAENDNYRFSLPNKIFDYMQAGTAILASDVVEVTRIVNKYKLGLIIPEVSVAALSQSLAKLLSDEQKLNYYQENCRQVALHENWENECQVLAEIYPKNE